MYVGININRCPFGFLNVTCPNSNLPWFVPSTTNGLSFLPHIGINIYYFIWRHFLFGYPNRPLRPPEQSALFGYSEMAEPEPEQKKWPIGRYKGGTGWPNRGIRRTDAYLFGSFPLFGLQSHSLTASPELSGFDDSLLPESIFYFPRMELEFW